MTPQHPSFIDLTCPACNGKGTRFFLVTCSNCSGRGFILSDEAREAARHWAEEADEFRPKPQW